MAQKSAGGNPGGMPIEGGSPSAKRNRGGGGKSSGGNKGGSKTGKGGNK